MKVIPVRELEFQILSKIDSIRKVISEIKFSHRAIVPEVFIDLIYDFLGRVRKSFLSEVEDIRKTGFEDEEEQVTMKSLRYMASLRKLHEKLFPLIDTCEAVCISNETQFALKNLIKKFPERPNFEMSLIPTWEYNYSVYAYKDLYRTLCQNFGLRVEEDNDYPDWFVFLKYPNIEANNILLNCVFSHEIGHLKDYINGISSNLIEQVTIDGDEFNKCLEPLMREKIEFGGVEKQQQITIGDFIGERIRQTSYEQVHKVMHNWLKEIIADILAVRTFGPAFVYSLIEYTTLLQLMEHYTDSHPASSWRISYCLSELDDIGFIERQENSGIKKYLKEWGAYLEEIDKEPSQPVHKVGYLSLENSFENIVGMIRDVSRGFEFNVEEYNEKSEIIKEECLLRVIAPIAKWNEDHHDYFENIYIVNTAWEIFITDRDSFYRNFDIKSIDDKISANEVLFKITLKALESSDILRIWKGIV
jgi:hypothetical protein